MDEAPAREPEINKLFRMTRKHQGSDLYLQVGSPPSIRLRGVIREMDMHPLSAQHLENLLFPIMYAEQKQRLDHEDLVEFSYAFEEGEVYVMKVSKQSGQLSLSAHRLDVAGED